MSNVRPPFPVVLNPEAIGNPDATPIVKVSPEMARQLIREGVHEIPDPLDTRDGVTWWGTPERIRQTCADPGCRHSLAAHEQRAAPPGGRCIAADCACKAFVDVAWKDRR